MGEVGNVSPDCARCAWDVLHVLRLYEISKSDPVQKYNLREIKHFECARCYMQAIALDGKIRKQWGSTSKPTYPAAGSYLESIIVQQVLELCLVSKWFMIFQSVYSAFRDPVNMLISSTGLKLRVRPEPPPPPPLPQIIMAETKVLID